MAGKATAPKAKTKPAQIELTPVQVRRLIEARGEYSRVMGVHADAFVEADKAYQDMLRAFNTIIEGAGHEANGATWDIEEDGDSVRLKRREEA